MATFRYVFVDVFTDTPLEGNQLAVFTDARELDDATMQAIALEIGFSETVFVLPARERRPRADPDLHALLRAPLRRPPDARLRVRPRRRRCSSARSCSRRVAGTCRCDSSATRAVGSSSGGWSSRCRPCEPFADAAPALRGARRRGLRAAGRAVRQRRRASSSSARLRGGARRRCSRTRSAVTALGMTGVSCFAGVGREVDDAHVLRRRRLKTRPPAPPQARSPATSPATAGSRGATRSRSRRAPRSVGRRRSTRVPTGATG